MTERRLLSPLQKMLLDGADYIEKFGHWKGSYFRGVPDFEGSIFPPACLMGSLQAATRQFDSSTLVNRGEAYINKRLQVNDCTAWNDQEERTPAEVIQALRDAAASYTPAVEAELDAMGIVEQKEEEPEYEYN